MFSRVLSKKVLAAIAGASLLASVVAPASAFTLSAPTMEPTVATSNIEHVWWHHHWHHWHSWHRHCWVNPWGHVRCHYW